MGKILNNFVLGTAAATAIIGKNIVKTLSSDKDFESTKSRTKDKIKDLKSFLDSNKEKLHRSVYFDAKAKFSNFDAKITRIEDASKMKDLEKEVKNYLDFLKKKA